MFKLFALVLKCGPRIVWEYFAWMRKYAKNPEKYPLEEKYSKARNLLIFVAKKMKWDLDVEGLDFLNDDSRKYMIVANHQSMVDIIAMICLSKTPITFIGKDSIAKMPFVGKIMKALEGEFLVREDLRQSIGVLNRATQKVASGRCSVVVYPEGHRTHNPEGELQDFHAGSFKIAYKANCPIVPVAQYGMFRPLDTKLSYKSYPMTFRVLKPIEVDFLEGKSTQDVAEAARDLIYQNVVELREKDRRKLAEGSHKQPVPKGQEWFNKYL